MFVGLYVYSVFNSRNLESKIWNIVRKETKPVKGVSESEGLIMVPFLDHSKKRYNTDAYALFFN